MIRRSGGYFTTKFTDNRNRVVELELGYDLDGYVDELVGIKIDGVDYSGQITPSRFEWFYQYADRYGNLSEDCYEATHGRGTGYSPTDKY